MRDGRRLNPEGAAPEPKRRGVGRNFLALGSGEAAARLIAFGVTMILARVVGPDGYGVVALAMGVNLYLIKIADGGVDAAGTQSISGAPGRVSRLGSAVLTVRVLVAVAVAAITAPAAFFLLPRPEGPVLALFTLTLIPVAAGTRWIHVGLEDARPVGWARVAGEALALGGVVVFVSSIDDLWVVPLVLGAGELLFAALLLQVLVRRGYRFRPRWDWQEAAPVFRRGFPLLIQTLLGLLIYNADIVLLRVFQDRAAVGHYGAAYALISFMANLGMAWGLSLLPALTRAGSDPVHERALYRTGLAQACAVTLPVAAGGWMVADGIVALAYGGGFEPSVVALQILLFSVPLTVVRNTAWYALVARGRGDTLTWISVVAVVFNVVLNLALIPTYSIGGAAVATVATEALICVLSMQRAAREGLGWIPAGRLLRPAAATAAMVVALALAPVAGLFVPVVLGVVVFVGVLGALGGIRLRPAPGLNV
ncbi:MAG: oligosaccharide flippase family protein [Gemmatimonadetes bacterium]|nr:oligosaccharide flippase family protein [Gemmatimonadota bacterium]NNK62022.1 oligosaccharide flippase family protein [Gemmatimonadota bacterium]